MFQIFINTNGISLKPVYNILPKVIYLGNTKNSIKLQLSTKSNTIKFYSQCDMGKLNNARVGLNEVNKAGIESGNLNKTDTESSNLYN